MDLYKSIENRVSIRKYSDERLSEEVIRDINGRLKGLIPMYGDIGVRLELITNHDSTDTLLKGFVGSYGMINAPYCIAAVTEEKPGYMENAGFLQEQLVLELTDMGIATCWVAGSFDKEKAKRAAEIKEGELLTDVIALGYRYSGSSFFNSGFRKMLGSHKRKARNIIAFDNKWGEDAENLLQKAPAMAKMLDAAILAPSAGNNQPVRVVFNEAGAAFFTMDKKGIYKHAAMMDAGIFISHFYLSAKEEGKIAAFIKEDNPSSKYSVPGEYSYVTTLQLS